MLRNICVKKMVLFTLLVLLVNGCAEIGMDSDLPVRPNRLVLLQKYGAAMRETMPVSGTTDRTLRSWSVTNTNNFDSAFQAYGYGEKGTVINRLLGYGGPSSLQMNLEIFDNIVEMVNTNLKIQNGKYLPVNPAFSNIRFRSLLNLPVIQLSNLTGQFVEINLSGTIATNILGYSGEQAVIVSNQRIMFEQRNNGDQILLYYVEPIMLSNGIPQYQPMALLLYGYKSSDRIDFRIANIQNDENKQTDFVQVSIAVASNNGDYHVRARMDALPVSSATGTTNIYLLDGDQSLFSIRMKTIWTESALRINDECFNVNPRNFAKLYPEGEDGSVTNTSVWSGENALTNIAKPLVRNMDRSKIPFNPQINSPTSLRWW